VQQRRNCVLIQINAGLGISNGAAHKFATGDAGMPRQDAAGSDEPLSATLERIPFQPNRDARQVLALAHVLYREPVSAVPGHALKLRAGK
jgi:hypothetical protein